MFAKRIAIGIKNRTVLNPAHLTNEYENVKVYEGDAKAYDFKRQTDNKSKVEAVLARHAKQFDHVASARYTGDRGENHRFVAATADNSVIWYKYVAYVAQGGQNHLFITGIRLKVSVFLSLSTEEQDALLTGKPELIAADRMKWINEHGTLWN